VAIEVASDSPKRLGFFWAGGFRSETNRDDRYFLLVFTKGKRVVMWVDFPREIASFYPLFKQGPIARSNPSVSLQKVGDYVTVTRPGAASPEATFKRYKDGGRTVEVVRADQLGLEPRRQPETSKVD
jgi:hypothetical protein